MELAKLQRRKQKAVDENNDLSLAEMCNKLGNYYMTEMKYREALDEFQEESTIHFRLDKQMDFGRANRMVGEVLLMMERYKDALKHENIYLKAAKTQNDLVELQRAYATIGRCYLLLAEDKSVAGSDDSHSDFKAAEKSFLKSLIICKDLKHLVSKWELADMQARLYLNLGVTKEQLSEVDEAINNYETAIKISKSNDLFDLHHKCLMANGFLYSKKDDSNAALNLFNQALEVAKRIQDKHEKTCETLLAKGSILIQNGDFQSAKQVLKKAYRLKTPNQMDKDAIQSKLKTVLSLCQCEDSLVTTNSYDYAKRKQLFEKLGDGLCRLKNFNKAIEFYSKALEAAQLNAETDQQLIPIYVSLYQTYIDNKQYNKALEFMQKEYELIKDVPKEAAVTLMGIGKILDLAGKDFWESEAMFKKALDEARKSDDLLLEKDAMQKFVKFCRKNQKLNIAEMLESEAIKKGIELSSGQEDTEFSEDVAEDLDVDLQLSSDPESSDDEKNRTQKTNTVTRKRRPAMTIKKNAKGETRLHEACINGNYQLAKMLIEQGHALNVRDNAGWLPLHEAAIHGHRDIVELLLDNGGQTSINDKGGTSCDGITPLYDAASNGNLSVVQLLLDRGAKSTVKTDFNETPLDALLRWFGDFGQNLSTTEFDFYKEIKRRLEDGLKKIGIETATNLNTASSGYNSGKSRNSQPKMSPYRINLSDNSEDEENSKKQENIKKTARLEYKNAIKNLKAPKIDQISIEKVDKRRSAHLTVAEVDPDDWLEDDLAPMRKKQKTRTPVQSPMKTPEKQFSRKSSSILLDFDSDAEKSDSSENVLDAFDVVMGAGEGSGLKPRRRRTTSRSSGKTPSQPSLLDSGFARYVEPREMPAVTTTEITNSRFTQYLTPGVNLNDSIGQVTEKPIVVKVQVGDEKILVPIKNESGDLKISWLSEEVARRYYCIKGIRPDIKLKTADGATLLLNDPISLVLNLTEDNCIHSDILEWKLPSLSKRYIEACSELKTTVDIEITDFLEVNRSAVNLDFSNLNLNSTSTRPIMKALQHQQNLVELNLSSNCFGNDGVKSLAQMLLTLKDLEVLNISGNNISEEGLENLSVNLERNSTLTEIRTLKLNFNPIQSSSLKFISSICRSKNVSSLSLVGCDLSETSDFDSLEKVKNIDVSYNQFSQNGLESFLSKINSNVIESLNLSRCSTEFDLGSTLTNFLTSKTFPNLKEINFSGLNLNENEILDILRGLEKCEKLKILDLSHQKQLTFLSFKYILVSMECQSLLQVKLLGCENLQKTDKICNVDGNCQKYLQSIEISLPKETVGEAGARKKYVDRMKDLWQDVNGCQGFAEEDGNILKLIRRNDNVMENFF